MLLLNLEVTYSHCDQLQFTDWSSINLSDPLFMRCTLVTIITYCSTEFHRLVMCFVRIFFLLSALLLFMPPDVFHQMTPALQERENPDNFFQPLLCNVILFVVLTYSPPTIIFFMLKSIRYHSLSSRPLIIFTVLSCSLSKFF